MGVNTFLDLYSFSFSCALCSLPVLLVIFSRRYAESPWRLSELASMLKTKAESILVFYDVTPSDLNCGMYADALVQYLEKGIHPNEFVEWKEALSALLATSSTGIQSWS
ncbi:hypothetical protein SUGI_0562910 [Cryptomeria japonica]|nr:hypothetical protein SUGI_0562910 [Cryptomeria japonica]